MTRIASKAPGRQGGIAAITAILVVAIATLLAVELAWELNLDVRRTEAQLQHEQARQFAIGAELIAINALRTDFDDDNEEDGGPCDDHDETWHTELTLPFEGGSVRALLSDMQGRFNLNNLIIDGQKNQGAYEQFERLLEVLDLDSGLAAKVLDWMDPDQISELGGAEDDVYTGKMPPYRTANTWFTTPTELLAVDGFIDPNDPGAEVFKTLERYIAALPPGQKINVNTAEDPILLTMSTNPLSTNADNLKTNRPYCQMLADPGAESGAFMEDAKDIVEVDFANQYLDVATDYFQLKVLVTLGTTQLTMYSLLYRNANGIVTTSLRYFDTK
jgi:general secretion pathway protein K